MSRFNLLSRRQWIVAMAAAGVGARRAEAAGTFQAVEVNHVALRVADLAASEEFYRKMFGAPGIIFERPGQRYMRMGRNFVALFEKDEPAMDHFAISVEGYDADAVETTTADLGLKPRRSSSFVYVHDPDGIEVQIAHAEHEVHSPVVREAPASSVFRGTGVNHVALRVSDVDRSRDFYQGLFGLPVVRQSQSNCFLGMGENFLALFRGEQPGMDHFCISVEGYEPEGAAETLSKEGFKPRREGERLYFQDPNGLTIQLAPPAHRP